MRTLRAVVLFLVSCFAFSLSQAAAALSRGPYLQMLTKEAVTICWRTDGPLDSRVRFGLAQDELAWEVTDVVVETNHVVTLTNLAPGTKYFYSINTGSSETLSGADYYFNTAPDRPRPIRIWA